MQASTQEDSMVFPRGSGLTTPGSAKQAKRPIENGDQGVLFGAKKRLKTMEIVKPKSSEKTKTKLTPSIGLGIVSVDSTVTKISYLKSGDFKLGSMFVGCVLTVNADFALVSSPGGHIAYLPYDEVSDYIYNRNRNADMDESSSLSALLKPMQIVRCCVIPPPSHSTNKSPSQQQRLYISCRTSMINRNIALKYLATGFGIAGQVLSKEDHGYLIDLGIPDVHAFLPVSSKSNTDTPHFVAGQLVECVVREVNKESRTVTLRLNNNHAFHEEPVVSRTMPFLAITPGMLFTVVLENKLKSGLVVNYLSLFHGVIDRESLPILYTNEEWEGKVFADKIISARVVFVDHASKTIRLSMRPHIIEFRAPRNLIPQGEILHDLVVIESSKSGIVLRKKPVSTTEEEEEDADEDGQEGDDEGEEGGKKSKKASKKGAENEEGAAAVVPGATSKKDRQKKIIEEREQEEAIVLVAISSNNLSPTPNAAETADDDEENDDQDGDGNKKKDSKSKQQKKSSNNDKKGDDKNKPEKKTIDPKKILTTYPIGHTISMVRIRGYKLIEGVFMASNIKDFVQSDVLHMSDVTVGQIHQVLVRAVHENNVQVLIASKITAKCVSIHSSDAATADSKVTVQAIHKNFQIGSKRKMRVWEIVSYDNKDEDDDHNKQQHRRQQIYMTNKKTLVDLPDKNCIFNIEDVPIQQESVGIVQMVSNDKGMKIRFFNGIFGILPMNILVKQGILEPAKDFRVGQLMKVLVLHKVLFSANQKPSHKHHQQQHTQSQQQYHRDASNNGYLVLALNTSSSPEVVEGLLQIVQEFYLKQGHSSADKKLLALEDDDAAEGEENNQQNKAQQQGTSLQIVSGTVFGYEEAAIKIMLDDHRVGKLPFHLIHDFSNTLKNMVAASSSTTSELMVIKELYPMNHKIEAALVTGYEQSTLLLTTKPLLVKTAQAIITEQQQQEGEALAAVVIPWKMSDLQPGQVAIGYIHKVDSFGVLVKFRGRLTALAPRPNIANRFISTAVGLFEEGDSIRCVIQRVDLTTNRIIITFKPGMVPANPDYETHFLHAYCREKYLVAQWKSTSHNSSMSTAENEGKLLPNWQDYRIGTVVKATVSSIEDYGILLLGQDQVSMMLADHQSSATYTVGKAMKVLILDINFEHCIFHVQIIANKKELKLYQPSKTTVSEVSAAVAVDDQQLVNVLVLKVTKNYLIVRTATVHPSTGTIVMGYVNITDYHHRKPSLTSSLAGEADGSSEEAAAAATVAFTEGSTIQVFLSHLHYPLKTVEQGELQFPHEEITLFQLPDTSGHKQRKMAQRLLKEVKDSDEQLEVALLKQPKGGNDNGEDDEGGLHQQRRKRSNSNLPQPKNSSLDVQDVTIGEVSNWTVYRTSATEMKLYKKVTATTTIFGAVSIVDVMKDRDGLDDHLVDHLQQAADLTKSAGGYSRYTMDHLHAFHAIPAGKEIECQVLSIEPIVDTTKDESAENEAKEATSQQDTYYRILLIPTEHAQNSKQSNISKDDDIDDMTQEQVITPLPRLCKGIIHKIHPDSCELLIDRHQLHGKSTTMMIIVELSFLDVSEDVSLCEKFRLHCYLGLEVNVIITRMKQSGIYEANRVLVEKLLVQEQQSLKKEQKKEQKKDQKKVSKESAAVEAVRGSKTMAEITTEDIQTLIQKNNTMTNSASSFSSVAEGEIVRGFFELRNDYIEQHNYKSSSSSTAAAGSKATAISLPSTFTPFSIQFKDSNKFAKVPITELSDSKNWKDLSELYQHLLRQDKKAARQTMEGILGISHGQIVACVLLKVEPNRSIGGSNSSGRMEASLRMSRLQASNKKDRMKNDPLPHENAVIPAYVTQMNEQRGCFVRLSNITQGRVLIKDLSDEFLEHPKDHFPIGKLVFGKVLKVDHLSGTVSLDLKTSEIEKVKDSKKAFARLEKGQIVKGIVESVKEVGVFVRIDGTPLVGLARVVAALQDTRKTIYEEYQVGDVVRARVLQVNKQLMKISLGLREKFFHANYVIDDLNAAGAGADEEEGEEDDKAEKVVKMDEEEQDEEDDEEEDVKEAKATKKPAAVEMVVTDYDIDDVGEEVESSVAVTKKEAKKNKRKLSAAMEIVDEQTPQQQQVAEAIATDKKKKAKSADVNEEDGNKFNKKAKKDAKKVVAVVEDDEIGDIIWGGIGEEKGEEEDKLDEDEDEDEQEEGKDGNKKKKSKQKDQDRKRMEKELRDCERKLAEGDLIPESADDFERLLLAQPNSSYLWIQYLAFHVKNTDIEAARVIGNRALRTIHFREEQEKFNLWIAILNMEYRYGSKDSFDRSFTRAVSESKGKLIYLSLATTMEQTKDIQGAEQLFEKALKRPQYRKSKKMWIAYHGLKIRTHDVTGAKAQLSRSLQAVSKHKHVEIVSKYALEEFEHGSMDRGRVLFEELISSYPKRTDLWHLYVDKEAKLGHINESRQLYERMLLLKLNTKNMKTIFKKYLLFETKYGDDKTQESVRQKARSYVNKTV